MPAISSATFHQTSCETTSQKDRPLNPRLTIAIPTYNRAEDLMTALQSLFDQEGISPGDPMIEVLVSDNASTDSTPQRVSEAQVRCPWAFVSRRNPENLGFSGNLQALFEAAQGDYVFLLSDDDALEKGCLRRVLKELESEPGVLVVNASVRDSALGAVLAERMYPQFLGAEGQTLKTGEDLFREAGWLALPLVTGHVVRRLSWLTCPPEAGRKSICMHIFRVLRILSTETARVVADPLVLYRTDNADGRWNLTRGYPFNFQFDVMEAWLHCRGLYRKEFYKEYFLALRPTILSHLRDAKRQGRKVDLGHFYGRLVRSYDFRVVIPVREVGLSLVPPVIYRWYTRQIERFVASLRKLKRAVVRHDRRKGGH